MRKTDGYIAAYPKGVVVVKVTRPLHNGGKKFFMSMFK